MKSFARVTFCAHHCNLPVEKTLDECLKICDCCSAERVWGSVACVLSRDSEQGG